MRDSQKQLILESLTAFFDRNPSYRKQLWELITGVSPVSLRLIDFFVTHYSKANNVLYWIDDKSSDVIETPHPRQLPHLRKFYLYLEYRAQLKSYTKLDFDPFRRHKRITFVIETSPELVAVETTVGQLNFFRWALQNSIVNYIRAHIIDIEHSMTHEQQHPRPLSIASSSVKGDNRRINPSYQHTHTHTDCDSPSTSKIKHLMPTHRIDAQCHIRFD